MRDFLKNGSIIPGIITLILVLVLIWWLKEKPSAGLSISEPGKDKPDTNLVSILENVKIGEFFEKFLTSESQLTDKWPKFRGVNSDNIKQGGNKLINTLKKDNSQIMWSVELGEGHAGPAVYNGDVFLLDYDEQIKADMLRCFSLSDGKEKWRRWYPVHIKRNHGMSRTVPAVNEKYVVTIGPRCHVMCVERLTGNFLWGIDIEKEFESEVPLWYTGQCPLIDNNIVVIATGGKSLMIGVDCTTGKIIWETPNPNKWKMSHSSVIPYQFNGTKMYVYAALGGICGIGAEGENTGKILWENSEWNPSVVAPSPVCMPDGRIFLTAGYGAGSMVIRLTGGQNIKSGIVQKYKPAEGLACEQQTPVYTDGLLFGIMPKDGGVIRNQFVCVSPDDCKKTIWTSGKEKRFGLGPYILADGKFYLLNDDGTLLIIKKSSKKFILLDEKKLFDGQDAWAPLAVADGYLLLRDSKTLYCINIKA